MFWCWWCQNTVGLELLGINNEFEQHPTSHRIVPGYASEKIELRKLDKKWHEMNLLGVVKRGRNTCREAWYFHTFKAVKDFLARYHDKISVYLKRHPRAISNTQLTSTQELVRIHNRCGYKIAILNLLQTCQLLTLEYNNTLWNTFTIKGLIYAYVKIKAIV